MDTNPTLDAALASTPSLPSFLRMPNARHRARWSPEEDRWLASRFIALRQTLSAGKAAEVLAAEALRNRDTVMHRLQALAQNDSTLRAGLPGRGKDSNFWTRTRLAQLRDMILAGHSTPECAQALGVPNKSISFALKRYSLRPRDLLKERRAAAIPEGHELVSQDEIASLRRAATGVQFVGRHVAMSPKRLAELEAAETVVTITKGLLARLSPKMREHAAFHQLAETIGVYDKLRNTPPA